MGRQALFDFTPSDTARHIFIVSLVLALLAALLTGPPSWAGAIHDIQFKSGGVAIQVDAQIARASRLAPAAPARIVLDLARPAIVTEGRFAPAEATLTLELRTVDDARFARAAAEGKLSFLPPFSFALPSTRHSYSVSVPVPPRPAAFSLPRIQGEDDDRPLVVIDAGHGGQDPGSISATGVKEKDLALAIARAVRDELLASGRARVALTRDDDRYLLHRDRVEIARKLGASLFISVHCDAAHSPDATGASVYTLSEVASDKEAARLAARENKSDILAGIDLGTQDPDVSPILIDLTQRETMNASSNFARLLGREAQGLIPVKPTPHRMASLLVLKAPDLPSVLFETGYVSNEADVALLSSPEGQRRIAQSVDQAVAIYFAMRMTAR